MYFLSAFALDYSMYKVIRKGEFLIYEFTIIIINVWKFSTFSQKNTFYVNIFEIRKYANVTIIFTAATNALKKFS